MKFIDKMVPTLLVFMAIITIGHLVWFGFCGRKTMITEENFNEYMSLSYEFINQNDKAAGVTISIKPKSNAPCEYNNLSIAIKVYTQYSFVDLVQDYEYVKWINIDNNGEGNLNCLHFEGFLDIYGDIGFMVESAYHYKWIGRKVELYGVKYKK